MNYILTFIMPTMNITYKMPHVSTKLYSYIYVYTVRNKETISGWKEYMVKYWMYPLWNSLQAKERKTG